MIIESYEHPSLASNRSQPLKRQGIQMAMSKLTLKQNGHSSTNENRTDDDYGGGGEEKHPQIPS